VYERENHYNTMLLVQKTLSEEISDIPQGNPYTIPFLLFYKMFKVVAIQALHEASENTTSQMPVVYK